MSTLHPMIVTAAKSVGPLSALQVFLNRCNCESGAKEIVLFMLGWKALTHEEVQLLFGARGWEVRV